MEKEKVPIERFTVWLPRSWAIELGARAAYESEKEGRLVTVPDIIRKAIIKTYYLSKDEIMPKYKSYKPKDIIHMPDLDD